MVLIRLSALIFVVLATVIEQLNRNANAKNISPANMIANPALSRKSERVVNDLELSKYET
jgi:hypothetical protein